MSLKVWLPLNGDLHNQGCSNVTVTNNGATVNTSGKIGSCYYFNASSYLYENTYDWTDFNTSQFSLCCWYKQPSPVASGNSQMICIGTSSGWNNIRIGLLRRTSNGYPMFSVSDGSSAVNYNCTATKFSLDTWNHIVCTYNAGEINIYLNGEWNKSYTTTIVPVLNSSQHLGIGAASNGAEKLTGYLNDIRIYDHCLSAAEVKEISQGLVLHYKLDDPNPNLITDDIYSAAPWATAVKAHEEYQGRLAYRVANNTLYSNTSSGTNTLFPNITFIANTQYTLSVTWRDDYRTDGKNSSLYLRFIYSDGSTATQMISPANSIHEWQHQSITSTAGKTVSKITTTYGNGGQLYITDLKLEVGTVDTGFAGNNHIIQDSSGYNYNGIIIGDLITVKDTKRYSAAIKWNSTDPANSNETGICYIQTPILITTPLQLSFSWWAKPENGYGGGTGQAALCTSNKSTRPDDYNTTAFHHRDNGFDICPSDGSGSKRLSFTYTKNEWHYYTLTYDGTTARAYKDGTETANVTIGANKTLATFNQLYIGYSQAGGVKRKTLGTYSDFRMYVTALSAADILQLYHTSAKIDNKKNLHTYELIENSSSIKINKRGQTLCNELQEGTAMKFYKTDSIIETNVLNEF